MSVRRRSVFLRRAACLTAITVPRENDRPSLSNRRHVRPPDSYGARRASNPHRSLLVSIALCAALSVRNLSSASASSGHWERLPDGRVIHVIPVPMKISKMLMISEKGLQDLAGPKDLLLGGFLRFSQAGSTGVFSGDILMADARSQSMAQRGDCKTRFAALVRDLGGVLASDPESLASVYEVFHKYFPIEKCNIEDVLAIARTSRFFVGSEEMGTYSVAFNSAGVSSRPGFAVLISVDKKTGNLERPFAKINGY